MDFQLIVSSEHRGATRNRDNCTSWSIFMACLEGSLNCNWNINCARPSSAREEKTHRSKTMLAYMRPVWASSNSQSAILTRKYLHPAANVKHCRWLEKDHEHETHNGEQRGSHCDASRDCRHLTRKESLIRILDRLFKQVSPGMALLADRACLPTVRRSCRSSHSFRTSSIGRCGLQSLILSRQPILQDKCVRWQGDWWPFMVHYKQRETDKRLTWSDKTDYDYDAVTNSEDCPQDGNCFWVSDVICCVKLRCIHILDHFRSHR